MPSSKDIKEELEKLQSELKLAEIELSPINKEKENIDGAIFTANHKFRERVKQIEEEHNRQLELHKMAKSSIDVEYREKLTKVNQVNFTIQDKKRALEAAITAEEQAAQEQQRLIELAHASEKRTATWDELTKSAPWRENAKDHQISGAAKLVEDRYVILADGMGLGKTLTSIITAEMAIAGSTAASKEFPWLGESKEVYVPEKFFNVLINGGTSEITGYIDYDRQTRMRKDTENYLVVPAHKETQVLNAITRPVGKKILFLCPSSLLSNTLNEFRRWVPHRNATYIGGFPKVVRNMVLENAAQLDDCVIICNYEAWRKDLALIDKLNEMEFDTIIIDEAHNAKDRKTSVFKGIERLCVSGRRPEYVIPMTGTPILNRPQELYTLLYIVAPFEFPSENDFLFQFCETYEDDNGNPKWRFQGGGLDRIAKRIGKNFLRRTKKDAGIILPPKTITLHELELDPIKYPEQARVREQMRKFATIIIDESKGKALSAAIKLAIFMRLRQIETWPAGIIQYSTYLDEQDKTHFIRDKDGNKEIKLQVDVEESQKMDYVIHYDEVSKEWDGLIPEVIADERIVVFSQFKAPLYELERRINASGFKAVVFNGETPKALRDEIRKDLDNTYITDDYQPRWDAVLCHYKVGGVGLNLTAATQMVILDEEWNPGKRDQAYDRIHRMGQEKPVTIHVVRNTPTIDNWLAGIVSDKDEIVTGFEDAMHKATNTEAILEALREGRI